MEFVGRGVKSDDDNGESRIGPAPRTRVIPDGFAARTPKQKGENSVLSDVCSFSNDKDNGVDALF